MKKTPIQAEDFLYDEIMKNNMPQMNKMLDELIDICQIILLERTCENGYK